MLLQNKVASLDCFYEFIKEDISDNKGATCLLCIPFSRALKGLGYYLQE